MLMGELKYIKDDEESNGLDNESSIILMQIISMKRGQRFYSQLLSPISSDSARYANLGSLTYHLC